MENAPRNGRDHHAEPKMKQTRQTIEYQQEPMGIVIAGGARGDVTPRVHAYIWGPAPEPVVAVEQAVSEPRAAA